MLSKKEKLDSIPTIIGLFWFGIAFILCLVYGIYSSDWILFLTMCIILAVMSTICVLGVAISYVNDYIRRKIMEWAFKENRKS